MGVAEVQSALARLYVDPSLRARFVADPTATAAELGLVDEDAKLLARVPAEQVERYAGALRRKRMDQARQALPLSARILGDRFAGLFARYAAEAPPRGSRADLDDPLAFARALGRWAGAGGLEPAWIAELARYELAWRQAARAGRVPVVRTFRFPVDSVARGLAVGTDTGLIGPRRTIVFWWRPTARSALRHAAIRMPTVDRRGLGLVGRRGKDAPGVSTSL
jgi:hypothetical protein